jgi:hypothetical protein
VQTLAQAGIDPAVAEIRAIKCRLDAEPRLSLRPAAYLAKVVIAR